MADGQRRIAHGNPDHQHQTANGQQHPQPIPESEHNDDGNEYDCEDRRPLRVTLRRDHLIKIQDRLTGQTDFNIGKLRASAIHDPPNFGNRGRMMVGSGHIGGQARMQQNHIHLAILKDMVALPLHLLFRLTHHFLTEKSTRPRRQQPPLCRPVRLLAELLHNAGDGRQKRLHPPALLNRRGFHLLKHLVHRLEECG